MSSRHALVTDCRALNCFYNRSGSCKTIGINVGGPEPLCDTYINTGSKGGIFNKRAHVGACKVETCLHNEALECMAEEIRVIFRDDRALCGSFSSMLL